MARPKKGTKPKKNDVGHNGGPRLLSKAAMREASDRLSKHEKVLETARGRLRNEYKSLKGEGFDLAALKRARADLRDDPAEAQATFDSYVEYRDLLGAEEAAAEARRTTSAAEGSEAAAAAGD